MHRINLDICEQSLEKNYKVDIYKNLRLARCNLVLQCYLVQNNGSLNPQNLMKFNTFTQNI